MKLILFFFTILITVATLNGQAPASFKYQAVLRDSRGNVKANTTTNISMDILQGSAAGTSVYSETHRVTTDGSGLINIDLGTGTVISGAMASINWGTGTYFLKISVDGVVMGTSQLLSVPYALYSTKAANGFSDNGAVKKLTVAGETSSMDSALFEVKNKNGQTVFAVYNEGVRIYVDDGTAKGAKGGFAIGGFGTKGASQNYLVVNPDSIRMFIDGNPGKGAKGGFAIGSFSGTKSTSQNLLVVNPDSIRAYIDTNSGKGAKGGFAIGGFGQTKGAEEEYLRITRDSTRVYINNTPSKAAKGGFAIGGFSNSKGERNDYLLISPDSTNFYVRSQGPEASSTFNILSVSENQIQKSLMQANSDTINMASVLNLQNNFNVYGNIGYTGAVTQIVIPDLTTLTPLSITQTTAISGGNIVSNGGAVIIASGVCWNTSTNPTVALTTKTTDGSVSGSFTSSMTGLTLSTTYYVRAYATNSAGTAYGNEYSFTTSSAVVTISDFEGNIYNTINLGTQTWMKENLKTTKYNDGTQIPNITDSLEWTVQTAGAFCWYNNDISNKTTFGALYNFYAVEDSRNLCPSGWHIPTDAEWTILINYLGGESLAGGKMKESGTMHWINPNTGASNESGFTALPGGYRYHGNGYFFNQGSYCNFWSSTTEGAPAAWGITLKNDVPNSLRSPFGGKELGNSVRCLKDF